MKGSDRLIGASPRVIPCERLAAEPCGTLNRIAVDAQSPIFKPIVYDFSFRTSKPSQRPFSALGASCFGLFCQPFVEIT